MERLTYRGKETMIKGELTMLAYSDFSTREIIKKLAEYEDLEEQGLLVRLPCKVGSTLYHPIYSRINEYKVIGICYDRYLNKWMLEVGYDVGFEKYKTRCDFSYIGRIVFLSKEEAEQKNRNR